MKTLTPQSGNRAKPGRRRNAFYYEVRRNLEDNVLE